jgi:hypothetical protein
LFLVWRCNSRSSIPLTLGLHRYFGGGSLSLRHSSATLHRARDKDALA